MDGAKATGRIYESRIKPFPDVHDYCKHKDHNQNSTSLNEEVAETESTPVLTILPKNVKMTRV